MLARVGTCFMLLLAVGAPAQADREILADVYLDKVRGMWLGQLLGNYAGRSTEGHYQNRGGNPAETVAFLFEEPWDGDDDTSFEYMYLHTLAANPDPTYAGIQQAWLAHVPLPSFYIANRQARYLMGHGLSPPATGGIRNNMHWYAIDSQITTEAIGSVAPGMRQQAADLVGRLASVSNDGYAVHAAQFYAAMYAAAALESNVETVVAAGLAVVPATSRTHQVIQDVRVWYAADLADGDGQLNWRATHERLYDRYVGVDSFGRHMNWLESTVNLGLTVMALLYGQGDFKETVRIGVLGGFDSDCNPATAGGLIGMIKGYSGLPTDLTAAAGEAYLVGVLQNIPTLTTISQVAAGAQAVAEARILAAGGAITGSGAARTYHLPDADAVLPPPERPDPAGPAGLVGQARAIGAPVTVSASIANHVPTDDRRNLEGIIDGITDVSYNGRLPYWTYDAVDAQPAGGDYYQLNFDRKVTFRQLTFHEGDIRWEDINADPRVDALRGGYFLSLTVEVDSGGVFTEVGNLRLSEPLDTYKFYQVIDLSFDLAVGAAIRIRGPAGGTKQFTSIVELTAWGQLTVPGDADLDGRVDLPDLIALARNWRAGPAAGWAQGDFDFDGEVGLADLVLLARHWGWPGRGGGAVPCPSAAAVLAAGAAAVLRQRRRTP